MLQAFWLMSLLEIEKKTTPKSINNSRNKTVSQLPSQQLNFQRNARQKLEICPGFGH